MTTNRTPVKPGMQMRITERAIEAFRELRKFAPGSAGWRRHHKVIHQELQCKPWQWWCVEQPFPDEDDMPEWRLEDRERWRMLERALQSSKSN